MCNNSPRIPIYFKYIFFSCQFANHFRLKRYMVVSIVQCIIFCNEKKKRKGYIYFRIICKMKCKQNKQMDQTLRKRNEIYLNRYETNRMNSKQRVCTYYNKKRYNINTKIFIYNLNKKVIWMIFSYLQIVFFS